ncbi:unnamed protein product [Darwinula stevensoni]|uniref:Cytochrome c oxidase subunit 4 n=1 Tax=Darwinula stevensoni TaxID=69355 RepID=A0A7R8WZ15_9CRUS|nr:unnamed protein product [Darwinula stevensoni]CAG0879683.1 unnamed protein product [Darwinula stevensoni]
MALTRRAFTILKLTSNQSLCRLTRNASAHSKIGDREVVGFGFNGEASYVDRMDCPMPAVRFRSNSKEIQALKEKEKNDWKNLTLDEKKKLYRASFCQTFAEIEAPTGEWKSVVGVSLLGVSLALWIYIWMVKFVYAPLPKTCSEEAKAAQLQRMIDVRANPVYGLPSKWDYEKETWKS